MIIAEDEKFFPGQQQEERVFLLIRKHWFNYLIFLFVAILMLIPLVILIIAYFMNPGLFSSFELDIVIAGSSAYLLFLFGIQLYGFVNFYLDVYIVTDRRIVDISQNGFFNREISELNLHQIQDVNAKVNGFFETVLHFGDIHIQTAGEHENFVFQSIPHPYSVAKQIVDLHEQQIEEGDVKDLRAGEAPDLGKNLSIEKLESQAKGILKQSSFVERIQNPGIFKSKTTPSATFDSGDRSSKTLDMEGELKEGREINLE